MMVRWSFFKGAAYFVLITPFFSCFGGAVLPLVAKDASAEIELTGAHVWRNQRGETHLFPVNPAGISMTEVRELTDGTIEITLGGSNVINGMPEGVHYVRFPDGNEDATSIKETDFPISGTSRSLQPDPQELRPLENSICLKSIAENAKYTVVTISGMLRHDIYTKIFEKNESLRLLSEFYIETANWNSIMFNSKSPIMTRELTFYQDPNLFTADGRVSYAWRIPRGNGQQNGGFSVLIWDGANPKKADFQISYDNGVTYKNITVNWQNVKFAEVPLRMFRWLPTNNLTVNSSYQKQGIGLNGSGASYSASVSLSQYHSSDLELPDTAIAEGLNPVFSPANATVKKFYFYDGFQKYYTPRYDGQYSTVELADRLRITAKKDAGPGVDTVQLIITDVEDITGRAVELAVLVEVL
ncbi:MAG: hypothetical protein LBD22_04285 [Spirochaetaceae bacterium]|jgi:hypothetical protein|nr:hypothetical protein [Spirochaetaceae bacterium]